MLEDFAVFILTHGRAKDQKTLKTLQKGGYTGKVYLVCDDEDETLQEYKDTYENVIVFSKAEAVKSTDAGDNFLGQNSVVLFARNVVAENAKALGLKYYLQIDDDVTEFVQRYIIDGKLK